MNTFKRYIRKRHKAVNIILDEPEESYDKTTYHKLRIEIKKVNDFTRLLKYCLKGFNREKIFRPYRRVFSIAGKLRELHIEEDMLAVPSVVEGIGNYMQNLTSLQSENKEVFFRTVCRERNRLDKMQSKLIQYAEQIDYETAIRYLHKCKSRIDTLINQNEVSANKIHLLRKSLIRFNHVLKCVDSTHKFYVPFEKRGLPQLLGKLHDCQVVTRRLGQAQKRGEITRDETEKVGSMREVITAVSESLYIKIQLTLAGMNSTTNSTVRKKKNYSEPLLSTSRVMNREGEV